MLGIAKQMTIIVIIISGLLLITKIANTEERISASIGQPVLPFDGKTVDKRDFSLNMLQGTVLIVNFWASWCPPCRVELPFFSELYKDLKEKGLEIVAVNIDTRQANAEKFLSTMAIPFIVVIDSDQKIVARYHPLTMPTSYIIDREGIIRYIHDGYSKKDQPLFREEIMRLLDAAPIHRENP